MKRWFLAWAMVMGIAHTAAAQAPGQTEPATGAFLEKRVPEELATDGVVLSRSNLGLRVEQVAGKWLVSLVDLTTGRAAASTKLDAMPADREAAVAVTTHAAAELAAQIFGRPAPEPAAEPPPPINPALDQLLRDELAARERRAAREQREAAELPYRRAMIRFNPSYDPPREVAAPRARWVAYRGDPKQKMDPRAFYREVGRPDLAESYSRRKGMVIGSFVGAGLSFLTAYFAVPTALITSSCSDLPIDQRSDCRESETQNTLIFSLVLVGVGSIGVITGVYYATHRQPISEPEARSLAEEYNRRLRGMPGAPSAQRSLLQDIRWTPYATGRGAGIGLVARF
jgi:hypothetical protein